MYFQTVNLQIAAQDLRFVEVRAREEERIRAAAQGEAGRQGWVQIGYRLAEILSRRLGRWKQERMGSTVLPADPAAEPRGCKDLVCPQGYVADAPSCTCKPAAVCCPTS